MLLGHTAFISEGFGSGTVTASGSGMAAAMWQRADDRWVCISCSIFFIPPFCI